MRNVKIYLLLIILPFAISGCDVWNTIVDAITGHAKSEWENKTGLAYPDTLLPDNGYKLYDLGAGEARDINTYLQIIGNDDTRAVLWTIEPGTTNFNRTTLPPIPNFTTESVARAINNKGFIVGDSDKFIATLWKVSSPGTPVDLWSGINHGVSDTTANDINDSGYVVGRKGVGDSGRDYSVAVYTVLTKDGEVSPLIVQNGYDISKSRSNNYSSEFAEGEIEDITEATCITNSPTRFIGGYFKNYRNGLIPHATTWYFGESPNYNSYNPYYRDDPNYAGLGDFGNWSPTACQKGLIVGGTEGAAGIGYYYFYDTQSGGNLLPVNSATSGPTIAYDVNEQTPQRLVGESRGNAALWIGPGGTPINLNSYAPPGWVLTKAYGINELGQIVGEGTFNGTKHAFLLSNFELAVRIHPLRRIF